MSVRISPKHGLNPTMAVCFFCGEHTGEIALLGKIGRNDTEAPREAVISYEPCKACKDNMSKGITLIGVKDQLFDRPPIASTENGRDVYPTGSMAVVTEDFVRRFFIEPAASDLIKNRKGLLPEEVVQHIIDQSAAQEAQEQEQTQEG